MAEREWLSPAAVAALLGVSRWTVYRRLIRKNELRASRVGAQWRISRTALDDYMRKTERSAQPTTPAGHSKEVEEGNANKGTL